MNEIKLSNDLNVLTTEIFNYQQLGGQVIFEIGKRLKHIKENDLVHGEWTKYCEETLRTSRYYVNKYIKVYEELKDTNRNFSFGLNKMYEIATMEDEQREQATTKGIPTDEGYKSIDEATQQEVAEYRRNAEEAERRAELAEQAKQQAESQAETERKERERLERENEELANVEPEIIEKEVIKEIIPENINEEIEQLKRMVRSSDEAFKQVEKELQGYRLKSVNGFDEELAEKELKKLQFEAEKGVLRLTVKVNKFLEDIASYGYMEGEVATSSKPTKEKLENSLGHLKNFIRKMETSLKGRIEV